MQGNEAEESIISALENIFNSSEQFDCVVIIRGGGSQTDLHCFNSYWLCYHITQFPLPIITGIGHERDETIADLVAHTSLKTPTAVAEFILEHASAFDSYLDQLSLQLKSGTAELLNSWKTQHDRLSRNIVSRVKLRMQSEKQHLSSLRVLGRRTFKSLLNNNQIRLNALKVKLKTSLPKYVTRIAGNIGIKQKMLLLVTRDAIKNENKRLENFENTLKLLDPALILKRGYTMTFRNGKLIKSARQLNPGDIIENTWIEGKSVSTINRIDY
jgi:exodeoxyribonuclease VII large subunit